MELSLQLESNEPSPSDVLPPYNMTVEDVALEAKPVEPDGHIIIHYLNPYAADVTYYFNQIETWYWLACGYDGHDPTVMRLIVRMQNGNRDEIPAIQIRRVEVVCNSKQYVEWAEKNHGQVPGN
jgi:hypothetical protein